MTIRRLNAMALLMGLSLVLFVIEMQVPPPLPLPGVKIGWPMWSPSMRSSASAPVRR